MEDKMKVSTRGRYATCALICLAEEYGKGPISLKRISQDQAISMKYLENIMRLFISAGIVMSVKGKAGGFILAKDPKDIKMGDVVNVAEGVVMPIHCIADSSKCPRVVTCPAKYMWKDLQEGIFSHLNSRTLYDLVNQKKQLAAEKGIKNPGISPVKSRKKAVK
jgi:Rrf2 family transcriptional regulator, cysteine metabolism repressor